MSRSVAVCAVALAMLVAGPGRAYDGFTSEFSHALAGAAMAGAGTAIADHYDVDHRGWIGFGASSMIGLLSESIQVAANPGAKIHSAALDVGSNMLGAAFGAWATDRYLLKPVIHRDAAGHPVAGLVVQKVF